MKLLKDKILKEGKVLPGNILKVDGFLNQRLDIGLLSAIGKEIADRFAGEKITKILTVEVSGIALACLTAQHFEGVPVIFGKKHKTLNADTDVYVTKIFSFTHNTEYDVTLSKRFLEKGDKVLIVDDFLANGKAIVGLLDIIEQAGAELVGVGIAIEKGFQGGGDALRKDGVRLESMAIVDDMQDGTIKFRE